MPQLEQWNGCAQNQDGRSDSRGQPDSEGNRPEKHTSKLLSFHPETGREQKDSEQ